MQRRTALQLVLGTVTTALGPAAAVAEARNRPWKTAIGLNRFASSSQKYDKTFPIWEILGFEAIQQAMAQG